MYSAAQIQEVLRLFGLALLSFTELTCGSNWTGRRYDVQTDKGRIFLKVRSKWWPLAQAEYVSGLERHLRARGFPVPELCSATDGECFGTWDGHICECHRFVEGESDLGGNDSRLKAAAHTLATLREMVEGYPPPGTYLGPDIGYPTQERVGFFTDRVRGFFQGQDEAIGAVGELAREFAKLDPSCASRCPNSASVVHGDYHPGNLLFNGNELMAVCDFDLAQAAPRAFDVAYFLYRCAGVTARSGGGITRLDRKRVRIFLGEYNQQLSVSSVPVDTEEVAAEVLRFAWYDTILTANITRDPNKLLSWFSDVERLSQDLAQWRASGMSP